MQAKPSAAWVGCPSDGSGLGAAALGTFYNAPPATCGVNKFWYVGRLTKNGKRIPVPVKPGDTVVFARYAGTEVAVGGEDYLIVRGDDIYAKD